MIGGHDQIESLILSSAAKIIIATGALLLGWGARHWYTASPPVLSPSTAVIAPAAPHLVQRTSFALSEPTQTASLSEAASLAESLADELAASLRQTTPAARDHALFELLPRLVQRDPSAAGHLALAWEPGALRDELLGQTIRQWTERDVRGAVTWLTSLLDPSDREVAANAMMDAVATSDPAGAIELANVLHLGLADGRVERVAQLWTEQDPRAAIDWALGQAPGLVRDRLLGRMLHVRAQQEPMEAAMLAVAQFPPGNTRDEAVSAVIRQWAVRDFPAATAWASGFAAGPLQARLFQEIEAVHRTL